MIFTDCSHDKYDAVIFTTDWARFLVIRITCSLIVVKITMML